GVGTNTSTAICRRCSERSRMFQVISAVTVREHGSLLPAPATARAFTVATTGAWTSAAESVYHAPLHGLHCPNRSVAAAKYSKTFGGPLMGRGTPLFRRVTVPGSRFVSGGSPGFGAGATEPIGIHPLASGCSRIW